MLFVLLLFFSSAQPFLPTPPLRHKEIELLFCSLHLSDSPLTVFSALSVFLGVQDTNYRCGQQKLVQLFSLCTAERLGELLWACIVSVYPAVWLCVVPTLRQNDAFSSIGGPGSNPASVEMLSLSPQRKNWSMCPTSKTLHEVKRFLFLVCFSPSVVGEMFLCTCVLFMHLIAIRHGDPSVIWNSGQNRNKCLLQFNNSTGTD